LLSHPEGRAALGELVREGRDRNISVEMITQNASDFTRSQEGRDILKNVNCYIFMNHQDVETGVSNFFNLSPRETVALRRLRTGTDLPFSEAIIRGPVNTKLRIEATEQEHAAITQTSDQISDMTINENTTTDSPKRSGETASQTDGGTQKTRIRETISRGETPELPPADSNGDSLRKKQSSASTFMELPSDCITDLEEPEVNASPGELLPEILPGWKKVKTDKNRWTLPVAEDWITATYLGPVGDRYMVHISKWKPEHVCYVIDELYGIGEPTRFEVWTVRGRYIFAVKIADGTIRQAKNLLAASPALSHDYLEQ